MKRLTYTGPGELHLGGYGIIRTDDVVEIEDSEQAKRLLARPDFALVVEKPKPEQVKESSGI